MPKIIDNVRERAITEAREILLQKGYKDLTIRQITEKLNIAPGTFYNYFPSKEYLAACIMLEDWHELTRNFETEIPGHSPEEVFTGLLGLVRTFTLRYVPAWQEYEKHSSSQAMIHQYHGTLIKQLAGYMYRVIPAEQREKEPWLAETLAELILRFGSDIEIQAETLKPAVQKLLKE